MSFSQYYNNDYETLSRIDALWLLLNNFHTVYSPEFHILIKSDPYLAYTSNPNRNTLTLTPGCKQFRPGLGLRVDPSLHQFWHFTSSLAILLTLLHPGFQYLALGITSSFIKIMLDCVECQGDSEENIILPYSQLSFESILYKIGFKFMVITTGT